MCVCVFSLFDKSLLSGVATMLLIKLKVAKVGIGLGLEVLRSPGIYANLLGEFFLVLLVTFNNLN